MEKAQVLLIEDIEMMQKIAVSALKDLCKVTCVSSLKEADLILQKQKFSLILLDVILPDGDGYDFCQRLRLNEELHSIPIVFLTGKGEIEDRVHGFAMGADDYIVKPFEPKEFYARIAVKLKRKPDIAQTAFRKKNISVNLMTQKASIVLADETETDLRLTPIEFKLLIHFLRNEEKIFSRDELLAAIWGNTVHVSNHTIDTHISSLRKKLGKAGNYLRSIVKKGYVFSFQEQDF